MTRKELIAYDRWLTENKWGSSEIITPEQAADLYLTEHPLPPAEGAEQRMRVRNILQDFYRRGEYELEQAEEDIMRLFQPQPTAEGAEEILDKYPHSTEYPSFVHENSAIAAMTEFATLHAQRIADKMVEEKWINVKDGLPEKDGKSSIYCLVNSKYDGIVVRPYNEYHKCWDAEDADDYYCDAIDGKITHWMPLPNPPIE